MRIRDWSSDVCASDLRQHDLITDGILAHRPRTRLAYQGGHILPQPLPCQQGIGVKRTDGGWLYRNRAPISAEFIGQYLGQQRINPLPQLSLRHDHDDLPILGNFQESAHDRSEEHTSELQSLMRMSYAVF